jgi:carbohydrate binding protein with CBM4/9 domain
MEKEWTDCVNHTKGYYNPTVVAKWIDEYDPASHQRDVWLLYTGDFWSEVAYKPHRMRMVLTYPSNTTNLAQNGGFEDGDKGWWRSPSATVVSDRPYRGSKSARVSNQDGFLQKISGLTPGDTYQVSGYLRVTAQGEDVRIGVKGYGGPELSTPGTQLQYTQGIINFKPTSTSATIYCWKWTGSSYAYCDEIQVSKP